MILTTGVIFNLSNFPLSSTWLVSTFKGFVQLLTTLEPSLSFCLNTFNRILDFLQCKNILLRHGSLSPMAPEINSIPCTASLTATAPILSHTANLDNFHSQKYQPQRNKFHISNIISQPLVCLAGGSYLVLPSLLMLPSLLIAVPGSSSALDFFQPPVLPAFPLIIASFPAAPRKPQTLPYWTLPYLPQLLPNYCFNCSIIRIALRYLKPFKFMGVEVTFSKHEQIWRGYQACFINFKFHCCPSFP